jgi:hypothetical protein
MALFGQGGIPVFESNHVSQEINKYSNYLPLVKIIK